MTVPSTNNGSNDRLCLLSFGQFRSSKWQIILQHMFGQLVMHPKHFSGGNVSIESSTVMYFQWSISWSFGQWFIKRKKKHTGYLYFLLQNIFKRACHYALLWWRPEPVLHVLDWTVCFSSCLRPFTYTAYTSHITLLHWSKTTSAWLCPDDQIPTGYGKRRRRCWLLPPNI